MVGVEVLSPFMRCEIQMRLPSMSCTGSVLRLIEIVFIYRHQRLAIWVTPPPRLLIFVTGDIARYRTKHIVSCKRLIL